MKHPRGGIKTWLAFVLLLMTAFGGVLWLQQRQGPEAPAPITETEDEVRQPTGPGRGFAEPSEDEKRELDNRALAEALSGGDCETIRYDEDLRLRCIDNKLFDSAIRNRSEDLCNQISDDQRRQECLDAVFLSLALDDKNRSVCERIVGEATRQRCFDQLNVQIGYTAASADECDIIRDERIRGDCLDSFYLAASLKASSVESCEQIQRGKVREECVVSVERQQKVSVAIQQQLKREFVTNEEKLDRCGQLQDEDRQSCEDSANYALALEKKDLSFCSQISDTDTQNDCVATQSANINRFYLKQAIALKDSSVCDRILDATIRSTCLQYAQ